MPVSSNYFSRTATRSKGRGTHRAGTRSSSSRSSSRGRSTRDREREETPTPQPIRQEQPQPKAQPQGFYDQFHGLSQPTPFGRTAGNPVSPPSIPESQPYQPPVPTPQPVREPEPQEQEEPMDQQRPPTREEQLQDIQRQIDILKPLVDQKVEEYRANEKERRDRENQRLANPYDTDKLPPEDKDKPSEITKEDARREVDTIFDPEKITGYQTKASNELSTATDDLIQGIQNPFIANTIENILNLEEEIMELSEEKQRIAQKIAGIGEGQITRGVFNNMLSAEILEYDQKISDIEERKERYVRTAELYTQFMGGGASASSKTAAISTFVDDQYRRVRYNKLTGENEFIRNSETGEIIGAPRPESVRRREEEAQTGDALENLINLGNFKAFTKGRGISSGTLLDDVTYDGIELDLEEFIKSEMPSAGRSISIDELERYLQLLLTRQKYGQISHIQSRILATIKQRIGLHQEE